MLTGDRPIDTARGRHGSSTTRDELVSTTRPSALERMPTVPPVVSGQLGRILDRRSQLAADVRSDAAQSTADVDRAADSNEEQDVARAAIEQLGAQRGR